MLIKSARVLTSTNHLKATRDAVSRSAGRRESELPKRAAATSTKSYAEKVTQPTEAAACLFYSYCISCKYVKNSNMNSL